VSEPTLPDVFKTILPQQFRENLSYAEIAFLEGAFTGEGWLLEPDNYFLLQAPSNRVKSNVIRADLIRWLCMDGEASKKVHPHGIQIQGAKISGDSLDLSYVSLPFPLSLEGCIIDCTVDLLGSKIPSLSFSGSDTWFISAGEAEISGNVSMGGAFSSRGGVYLKSAKIGGKLECSGGHFECQRSFGGPLDFSSAQIRGNVNLRQGFSAVGLVTLYGARIGGNLECDGKSSFKNPGGIALYAENVEVDGSLIFRSNSAQGRVDMRGIHVGNDLDCSGSSFSNPQKEALDLEGAEIKGSLVLNDSFSAVGEINLYRAHINGNLRCSHSKFNRSGGTALDAGEAQITGYVSFQGSSAEGEINLDGAHLQGDLDCIGAKFKTTGGAALSAAGTEIRGTVQLKAGFSADGEVNLKQAKIGGDLDCTGGDFSNPSGKALNGDRAEVQGSVLFTDGFCSQGEMYLEGIQIRQDLNCTAGRFGDVRIAYATIGKDFYWQNVQGDVGLNATDASVGTLCDDMSSWPRKGRLHLAGFSYGSISSQTRDAESRLAWLDRQQEFASQPYLRLAKVLSESGDTDGAKLVVAELERRTRLEGRRRILQRPARWLRVAEDELSDASVGYGIYPLRAVRIECCLIGLGWIIYRRAQLRGAMVPTDKDAFAEFRATGRAPTYYPPFSPLIYALENSLPLIKFGQDDHWQPADPPGLSAISHSSHSGFRAKFKLWLFKHLRVKITSANALRWLRWIMIALGWLLATFFVAGLTGIIRTS